MDPFNFMHQQAQGSAGQPRSTSSFDARYLTAQPGTLLQQRAVDEPYLDLGDLDDIIGGGLYISPDANYLLPPQTTLPAPYQPPSSGPTTAPPPSFHPPTAPAPPFPIPATKQPIPWKLQVAGVVDLGLDRKTHEHRFRLPLPRDVDKAFDKLRITVGGKRGFRIDSCVGLKHKDHPNHTILNSVDHAGMVLDQLIPGPNVVIQRGALPEEKLSVQTQAPTKKEPPYGFTLAHLLTVICRKHYNALNHSSVKAPEKLEGGPQYEWLWIVSVTRSDGREGPVRWFPELEVRIPPEWWNAPATASGTSSCIPRREHGSPKLLVCVLTSTHPSSQSTYSSYYAFSSAQSHSVLSISFARQDSASAVALR
ncbi:hypothetical protein OH76DRAFT_943578 [Lentinus brumalis]|uniref:Uncharacterized protein n=1 Tax=Lentinus brumalis TaxID=2498619 RepID=A0A371CZ18_9APHY|nr:hypothetical protein OH76DRAFT_943578 [Polyporus brumalis]